MACIDVPLDPKGFNKNSRDGREIHFLVDGVYRIVDRETFAFGRDTVNANDGLVEHAVDLYADILSIIGRAGQAVQCRMEVW